MTAVLVAAHQVVVLCNHENVRLFCHGEVYIQSAKTSLNHFPGHLTKPDFPMWGLLDVDFPDKPPRIRGDSDIWPIQSSSPKPIDGKRGRSNMGLL